MFCKGGAAVENFTVCLNAVLPMFILIAVGYVSRLAGVIKSADVPAFNKIAFHVFMPVLLFNNLYNSELSDAVRPKLMLFAVLSVLAVYVIAVLVVLKTVKTPERRGVIIQGIYRSNYVVIGLPIASAFITDAELGVISMLIAVIVPVYNILAVVTLEVFGGKKVSAGRTLLSIVTNPLILGAAAGILALLLRLRLPPILESVVGEMAAVGTPVQLFLLGAFFRFNGLSKYRKPLTWTVLARLVFVPAAVLPVGAALGFRGAEFVALIGCFASSNAISSFTMTQEMGGDDELAGDIVVLTSALCAVTAFLWCLLYKTLGII